MWLVRMIISIFTSLNNNNDPLFSCETSLWWNWFRTYSIEFQLGKSKLVPVSLSLITITRSKSTNVDVGLFHWIDYFRWRSCRLIFATLDFKRLKFALDFDSSLPCETIGIVIRVTLTLTVKQSEQLTNTIEMIWTTNIEN